MKRFLASGALALMGSSLLLVLWVGLPLLRDSSPPFDSPVAFLNDRSADIIGASALGAADIVSPLGLTGHGQLVGLADSGLDKGSTVDIHPDLASTPGQMPRVAFLKSWAGRPVADDPSGHGTHMAATIVGSGSASGGQYQGIAPGASLYVQGLLDADGSIRVPDDINDLFAPAYAAGVRVHVNGWGGGGNRYTQRTAQVDQFVRSAPHFLPVFGAGNGGPGSGTLTSEANSKNALVVGSSQTPRPSYGADCVDATAVASFSSRGPTTDGRVKPDLLVPSSAVVSACSCRITGNLPANPKYTRMGGTSMAAAIAGGAAALVREYLESQGEQPTAALVKAVLVQGARRGTVAAGDGGFGILDVAGSVLPLAAGMSRTSEDTAGLAQGEAREFRLWVKDRGFPLRVTLAWTDLPAATESAGTRLVNDLDLQVIDPKGKTLVGNQHLTGGRADRANNLETLEIAEPVEGVYTVRVTASRIGRGVNPYASRARQDFALVYGQVGRHGTLAGTSDGQRVLEMVDGSRQLVLGERVVRAAVNGGKATASDALLPGSDVWEGSGFVWVAARTVVGHGMRLVQGPTGVLVEEAQSRARSGGYMVDGAAQRTSACWLRVNGQTGVSAGAVPVGVEVKASVSPRFQTIWRMEVVFREHEGIVKRYDADAGTLELLREPSSYRTGLWTGVKLVDELADGSPTDALFSSTEAAALDLIAPGMAVSLRLGEDGVTVHQVTVRRTVIVGTLRSVDGRDGTLSLTSGREYRVLTGATIHVDSRP
ncbi:MAG: S8 family serine peptidase, partial [Syntrophomonadaceae bacterium]|nr:S8 family serine peptidase [Syntrophomonadaceae bacterium]